MAYTCIPVAPYLALLWRHRASGGAVTSMCRQGLRRTWRRSFYLAIPIFQQRHRFSPKVKHQNVHSGTIFSMISEASVGPKYRPSKESDAATESRKTWPERSVLHPFHCGNLRP